MTDDSRYIGRYAPSPTGPLHFGSLVAAMGSYLQARSKRGLWLLRIEDIDPPREVAHASTSIVRTLDNFGFEWDGPVTYQSGSRERHLDLLEQLWGNGEVFACQCSRKQLSPGAPYPGTCRGLELVQDGNSLRLLTQGDISFNDQIQGPITEKLSATCGDFVVYRRDGLVAYQLAAVIDDADQRITEVVRGADLLDNTARQIYLQQRLAFPTPRYCHLPLAVNRQNQKLSKQTHAPALNVDDPLPELLAAWTFLGQVDVDNAISSHEEFWPWAVVNWDLGKIPRALSKTVD